MDGTVGWLGGTWLFCRVFPHGSIIIRPHIASMTVTTLSNLMRVLIVSSFLDRILVNRLGTKGDDVLSSVTSLVPALAFSLFVLHKQSEQRHFTRLCLDLVLISARFQSLGP